jgi:CubicO group peptidase (beta-lactamase class C family)
LKRKTVKYILLLMGLGLCGGAFYIGLQYAYIGSSYASKVSCSCHFISGRSLDDIQKNDLYAVPYADVSIDEAQQSVTTRIYGMAQTTALYREGFGCTLLNDVQVDTLRKQKFIYKRETVSHTFERVPVSLNFDSSKLCSIIEKVFTGDTTQKLKTRAVIILKNGKLVYERYAEGFHAQTPLIGWSMTKSVTNALIGILVQQGKLNINQTAPVQEWQNDSRKNITINDLLHMSSGLQFEENYGKPSDATEMLFRSYAAGRYAIKSPLQNKAGAVFSYSSGTTNILHEIIRRQCASLEQYQRFPYEQLFDKIGMRSALLEPDPSGTYLGSSFMFANALDWARFGQLYLQEGVWEGEQILPKDWTRYAAMESPNSGRKYAAHFWVNHTIKDFPNDAYFADGFEGQFLNIIPSQNLVILRLGCSQGGVHFDNAKFVIDIIKAQLPK